MRAYLGEVWRSRHFWLSLVHMDLQNRYRRSVLGIGWSLLHPLATTLVICLVFHQIFHMDVRTFAPFLMAGLACWSYIVGVTLQGCQSFIQAESYIRQHPLPMAIYPLRTTLGSMIHLLFALGVVLTLAWTLKGFGNLAALVSLVPNLLLLFVFGWSLAVIMGFVNVVFRDMQHILEIAFQILFYLTPVMYPADVLRNSNMGWLALLNPLAAFLKLVREPILEGRPASLRCYLAAGLTTALLATTAVCLLRSLQRRVILYL